MPSHPRGPAAPTHRPNLSSGIGPLASALREDAILHMPLEQLEIRGRAAITRFFALVPADGHLDRIRLRDTPAPGRSPPTCPSTPAHPPGTGSWPHHHRLPPTPVPFQTPSHGL